MAFDPNRRADLSGVPAELQPGRAATPNVPQASQAGAARTGLQQSQLDNERSAFRSLLRFAKWVCIGIAVIFALALFRIFFSGVTIGEPAPSPEVAETAPLQGAHVAPAEPDQQALDALDEYETVMRNAASSSDEAQRQHAAAMKAVEAARALAKNPDSPEERSAFDKAIREVQAQAQPGQQ